MMNGTHYKRELAGTHGPGVLSVRAAQREGCTTHCVPFLPKQMLFLLKWCRSDLITGRKRKFILLCGEGRLDGLDRMGTRIHQSPGPLAQLCVLPQFPHLSKMETKLS